MIEDLGIIFAAAGSGQRYQKGNKLFEPIDSEPLFIRSIRNFSPLCHPENAVLVTAEMFEPEFRDYLQKFLPEYPLKIIRGGTERANSVQNGLAALHKDVKFVAIHDSARPLTEPSLLLECLKIARRYGGAVPGKPVSDTLKKIDESGMIVATVPREQFWHVETPQVFNRKQLEDAYQKSVVDELVFTDDAAVMEYAGYQVKMVFNHALNHKITWQTDLTGIQNIVRSQKHTAN